MNSANNEENGGIKRENSIRARNQDRGVARQNSFGLPAPNLTTRQSSMVRQNSAIATEPTEVRSMARQNSTRPRSVDPGIGGIDHPVPSPSVAYNQNRPYRWGFTDLASAFNWGVIVLTLGSYGLLLSTPVFWLCWSILVTEAVIFYSLRPYWLWIEKENSAKPDRGRAGAVFLKVGMAVALITMICYDHHFGQRQNKILFIAGFLIILVEGFSSFVLLGEEFGSLMRSSSDNKMRRLRSITEGHKYDVINFLTPSVINGMIGVTGAVSLGGNLGSLMTEKAYWILASILVVDLVAEAIHRFDLGERSLFDLLPEKMPNRHYLAILLRLIVEGCLCYWMAQEISQTSYFPSHMDVADCDGKCQERSKNLLITMVALGGLQAAATFTSPLWSCLLAPQYVPYF
ncbi:hypothetical protein KI387_037367, partial [Taxus chinensis]